MKNDMRNVLTNVLACVGAAAIGAGACWAGEKLYDKVKKKYATLSIKLD